LLLGSHLDTVRDAGRFDGPLGVLLPIVALADLKVRGVELPFHVEVLGFSEEEGVRFASAYLGSEGYAGRLKPATLGCVMPAGISVGEALQEFNGGKFSLPKPEHKRGDLLGYVEVHIEQGPVLEAKKLAVGVVSAIAGQSRFKLTWTGKAGHAGTTPMACGRTRWPGRPSSRWRQKTGARHHGAGRDGRFAHRSRRVRPMSFRVRPSTRSMSGTPGTPRAAPRFQTRSRASQIAAKRGLKVAWQRTQDNGAVACSPALTAQLARSVAAVQGKSLSLVSGAGHDGVVMSTLTPVAMLFVRCRVVSVITRMNTPRSRIWPWRWRW